MHLEDAYRSRLLLLSNRLLTYIFYRRKSSPLTHDPQSGHAADVTFLTEIAKFTNFTFFSRFCRNCSPFVMEIKRHPPSDAADYKFFYKRLSTPCKFWFQYEKHWAKGALQYRINAKTMRSVWRCRCPVHWGERKPYPCFLVSPSLPQKGFGTILKTLHTITHTLEM